MFSATRQSRADERPEPDGERAVTDEATLNEAPGNAVVLAVPLEVAGLLQGDAEVAGALGVGRVAWLLVEDGGAQAGTLGAGAEFLDVVGQGKEGPLKWAKRDSNPGPHGPELCGRDALPAGSRVPFPG
jgi:hypothetical protein